MKPILFYDAETTGVPDFKAPSDAEHQPHIVQLAALLVDPESRKTIASMNVIARPAGWIIPDEVVAVHGITTEHATAVGVSESIALVLFIDLWGGAGLRVAHNESFDARIIRIALKRHMPDLFYPSGKHISDVWKEAPAECTARLATPICNLPPSEAQRAKTSFKRKSPTLAEAYRHLLGRDFENAHSALADAQACRDVYFAIKDLKVAA